MSNPTSLQYRGVVHGDVIKLDQPLNVPDGQAVVVTVSVAPTVVRQLTAEQEADLHEACGSWSDDKRLDEYLEYVR